MEQKFTFRQARSFEEYANLYLSERPNERTQLSLAISKVLSRVLDKIKPLRRDFEDEKELLIAKFREKEKDGSFKVREISVGGGVQLLPVFLPEKERECNSEIRILNDKMLDEKTIDIRTHIVPIPPDLDLRFIEPFSNFVIKPMSEEDIDSHYLAQAQPKK
jgi:hypothetical protein